MYMGNSINYLEEEYTYVCFYFFYLCVCFSHSITCACKKQTFYAVLFILVKNFVLLHCCPTISMWFLSFLYSLIFFICEILLLFSIHFSGRKVTNTTIVKVNCTFTNEVHVYISDAFFFLSSSFLKMYMNL